ncbi:hypothetical protein GCM10007935_13970 [Hydrogenophaga electricum]|uniref:Uncharacterized protein n=1 Tax=Hydrogenophaga electricum TaxID=1230953 RepID=A0ABQ6C129_9BURK|nr:hypothetical protein GCM10007935_13970 [Hydrogenophaga electricum]
MVDRRAEGLEPRSAQTRLMAECRSCPLGCTPHADHDDAQNRRDLTVENPLVAFALSLHLDLRFCGPPCGAMRAARRCAARMSIKAGYRWVKVRNRQARNSACKNASGSVLPRVMAP